MFETDFPHATCLYPHVKAAKERSVAGLAPRIQRKLLYETAAKVYQLSLP
jgi:predicted TIM-barrel fold metal-dependent hydrolase